MIKLDNVSLVFQGGSVALSNISTTINEGEFVYLVGHSGSGKSSFLKLLYKEYISTKGNIEVAGLDVVQLPRWKTPLLRRKLGIVTQEPQLLEKRNTYENIAFALEVMGTPNDEIESKTNTKESNNSYSSKEDSSETDAKVLDYIPNHNLDYIPNHTLNK